VATSLWLKEQRYWVALSTAIFAINNTWLKSIPSMYTSKSRMSFKTILDGYGLIEPFQLDDADYVLVMSNAFATKGKAAVQRLRAQGVKAGLLRLRVLRPFPAAQIADVLENRKAVAVIDQNLARGKMRAEDNVDVVVVAGDGSTYDMAMSSVSGAIFRDLDFWYCLL
jgi:pyruvate/2-oxoacid:ferredoxin oxidoreductase alpha subunit